MKSCLGKRKLLALLALGNLDEPRARNLRSHVRTCEGCRRYLEDLSALGQRLAVAIPGPAPKTSEAFHQGWIRRLQAEPPASPWQVALDRLSWRVALPALGAVAAAVIVLLSLLPRQPAAPRQMQAAHTPTASIAVRDFSPSLANYQRLATRSLDEFDELLTAQARRSKPSAPVFTASIFSAARFAD